MSNIQISDVTNSTDNDPGNGVFDTLIQSIERLITSQYDTGRITGSDYSTVYLGALQETLKTSIAFIMQEQESGLKADLLIQQILQETEKIDLVVGQTAEVYERIASSQAETARKNLLNQKEVVNAGYKGSLIQAQTLGFASDTKQKVLKQLLDGYAVTLSISGLATTPHAAREPAIDALVFEILNDIGSTAMTNSANAPDLGVVDP